jgi:hypothetical protein
VTDATAAAIVTRGREKAAKVLPEGDTGVLGDPGRIRIEGLEKIPDFLTDLPLNDMVPLTARWDYLKWLDLVVHFALHPTYPRTTFA